MLNVHPYKQGSVYFAKLYADGSNLAVYKKSRPVIILNAININENIVIVVPTTTQPNINGIKVQIEDGVDSTIVLEKMFPIHVSYLERFIGIIDDDILNEIFYAMDILYGRLKNVPKEDLDKYFPNRTEFSVKFSNKSCSEPQTQSTSINNIVDVRPKQVPELTQHTTENKEPKNIEQFANIKRSTFNEISSLVNDLHPKRYNEVLISNRYTTLRSRMNQYEKDNEIVIINGIINGLTINDIYDVIKHMEKDKGTPKRKPVEFTIPADDNPTTETKKKYVRVDLIKKNNTELTWIHQATPSQIVEKYGVSSSTASKYKKKSYEILQSRLLT